MDGTVSSTPVVGTVLIVLVSGFSNIRPRMRGSYSPYSEYGSSSRVRFSYGRHLKLDPSKTSCITSVTVFCGMCDCSPDARWSDGEMPLSILLHFEKAWRVNEMSQLERESSRKI